MVENNIFLAKCPILGIKENATNGGTKHCVDLNSAYTYSSCNTIHCKIPYNKISIVMDLFHLYGIPKILKTLCFEKPGPFQLHLSIAIWITIM